MIRLLVFPYFGAVLKTQDEAGNKCGQTSLLDVDDGAHGGLHAPAISGVDQMIMTKNNKLPCSTHMLLTNVTKSLDTCSVP